MVDSSEFNLFETPLEGTRLIEASAGTGKTFTLTNLVLRLILEKGLSVDEILVVTFTEAATGELQDRIRNRLHLAEKALSDDRGCGDPMLNELLERQGDRRTVRMRLRSAITDFDQAPVCTIHGFCLRTLLDHAFAGGVLFDTRLMTDETGLIREITQDFWRDHCYGTSPFFFDYIREKNLHPEKLMALVGRGLTGPCLRVIPDAGMRDCSELEAELRERFERVREAWWRARDELVEILAHHQALNRAQYRKDRIGAWVKSMDGYLSDDCRGTWVCDGFAKFTLTALKKATKKGHETPAHPFFVLCEGFRETQETLLGAYEERLAGFLSSYVRTLRSELEDRKRRRHSVFFDDLLLILHRVLCGPGGEDLAVRLRSRFKAALIDEFQDTDAVQYAIFQRIFQFSGSGLFLIGDPKQAIYGFRGADIFTYLEASRRSSSRFTLDENWRSEPSLIEAVNALFANVPRPFVYPDITFQPARSPSSKVSEPLTIDGKAAVPMQIWYAGSDRLSEGQPIARKRAVELIPEAVAAEISRLLRWSREGRVRVGLRPLVEQDVAVLVRRNAEARLIQKALQRLGIHAVLYNMGNLFESHEAREVERVLTAVANPADERMLRAALATDMLGRGGRELDRLARDEEAWDRWLTRFGDLHESWLRHGFFRMFRRLLSEEAVLPRLMVLEDGERRCTNLLHLSEVLHEAAVTENLNPQGLLKWLGARRQKGTTGDDEHQLRLESDENAVRLVTVHKSKGLEYPVVFCPFVWDGSRLINPKEPFRFHDESEEMRLTLDVGSPERGQHLKLAEREQLAENLRLLYVALTRAKQHCTFVWGRFKGAETSALAYLLHRAGGGSHGAGSETADTENDPEAIPLDLLDAMAAHFEVLEDADLRRDLEALRDRARGGIVVTELPLGMGEAVPPGPGVSEELECRDFSGYIDRSWQVVSFSSLVMDRPERAETPASDEWSPGRTLSEERISGGGDLETRTDMFGFPAGTAAGIFLHEVFEGMDFQVRERSIIAEMALQKLKEHGFAESWLEPLCDMLTRVVKTPLESPYGAFSLSEIPRSRRLNEVAFTFPLRPFKAGELRRTLSRWVVGTGDDTPLPALERITLQPLEGYMKGIMDLVFEHDGRFYLVDWKSNLLGGSVEDYRRDALEKAMRQHGYHLQYYLYTAALHRYLATRLADYRYASHFGGIYYLFVRGMDPREGSDCGVYRDRPDEGVIEGLCRDLILEWRADSGE